MIHKSVFLLFTSDKNYRFSVIVAGVGCGLSLTLITGLVMKSSPLTRSRRSDISSFLLDRCLFSQSPIDCCFHVASQTFKESGIDNSC